MIEIEEAVKYFNDCKPKYLRRFSEKTPKGNCIKGWICKKSNMYLGSLLIDELNGEDHEQYVQSMPKIEYFNDERDICLRAGHHCAQLIIKWLDTVGTLRACFYVYNTFEDCDRFIQAVKDSAEYFKEW